MPMTTAYYVGWIRFVYAILLTTLKYPIYNPNAFTYLHFITRMYLDLQSVQIFFKIQSYW